MDAQRYNRCDLLLSFTSILPADSSKTTLRMAGPYSKETVWGSVKLIAPRRPSYTPDIPPAQGVWVDVLTCTLATAARPVSCIGCSVKMKQGMNEGGPSGSWTDRWRSVCSIDCMLGLEPLSLSLCSYRLQVALCLTQWYKRSPHLSPGVLKMSPSAQKGRRGSTVACDTLTHPNGIYTTPTWTSLSVQRSWTFIAYSSLWKILVAHPTSISIQITGSALYPAALVPFLHPAKKKKINSWYKQMCAEHTLTPVLTNKCTEVKQLKIFVSQNHKSTALCSLSQTDTEQQHALTPTCILTCSTV